MLVTLAPSGKPELRGIDSTSGSFDLVRATVAPPRPSGEKSMSQFGAEKFTTRSREAIETAQLAATTAGNTQTEPVHLLVALLRDADGTARQLVAKCWCRRRVARGPGRGRAGRTAQGHRRHRPAAGRLAGADPRPGRRPRPRRLDEGRLRRDRAPPDQPGDRRVGGPEAAPRRRAHRRRAARRADRRAWQPPGHQPRGGVDVREPREVLRGPHRRRRGRQARPRHRA